jgi:hypothetical protein
MQRYTMFFITVNALHVLGGFSAHHQELKTVHTASGTCQYCLLLPLAWVSRRSRTYTKRYAAASPQLTFTILKTFKFSDLNKELKSSLKII